MGYHLVESPGPGRGLDNGGNCAIFALHCPGAGCTATCPHPREHANISPTITIIPEVIVGSLCRKVARCIWFITHLYLLIFSCTFMGGRFEVFVPGMEGEALDSLTR